MRYLFLAIAILFAISTDCQADSGSTLIRSNIQGPAMQPQKYFLTYEAKFDVKQALRGEATVWIPFPVQDDVQTVNDYWVGGTLPPEKFLSATLKRENEYGNWFFVVKVVDPSPGDKVSLQCTVLRKNIANRPVGMAFNSGAVAPSKRLLQPDRLGPLDGAVATAAQEALAGSNPATSDGRDAAITAIYRKVSELIKVDAGSIGEGDVLKTLQLHSGGEVDVHASLVALLRSAGIPARLEGGVAIPLDKADGSVSLPHTWVTAFHPGRGWIPLDPVAGAANGGRFAEYYLGGIGSDHIAFSAGRDLKLGQARSPLNVFLNPYAEIMGGGTAQEIPMKWELLFKKLPIS